MRRKKTAAGAVGTCICAAIAWTAFGSGAACQLQGVCDPNSASIPGLAPDPNGPPVNASGVPLGAGMYGASWQSNAIDGRWLWFPGQRTYTIYPSRNDGTPLLGPYLFQAYIAAPNTPPSSPYPPSSNFVIGAGNSVEFAGLYETEDAGTAPDGAAATVQVPYGFQVTNATCSPSYLFLQVTPQAAYDEGGAPTSGTEGGASNADASSDGSDAGTPLSDAAAAADATAE